MNEYKQSTILNSHICNLDLNNLQSSPLNLPANLPKNYAEPLVKLFQDNEIRIVFDNSNNPWFVLTDILKALGSSTKLADAKISVIQGLGDGEVVDHPILDSLGRTQITSCVSKPAVTYLVDRSNTDIGKQLRKFIHLELLPELENKNKSTNNELELTPAIELLLTRIFDSFNKIIESQNAKIDELNNKVDLLIQANQYNLPAKLFSLQDCVDYLNINFATGNNKATVQSLKDFLRDDDVKFLKSNYKPYVKYINMHYVTYNSNPFNPVDTNLKFTKTGLEYIISELRRFNYIK